MSNSSYFIQRICLVNLHTCWMYLVSFPSQYSFLLPLHPSEGSFPLSLSTHTFVMSFVVNIALLPTFTYHFFHAPPFSLVQALSDLSLLSHIHWWHIHPICRVPSNTLALPLDTFPQLQRCTWTFQLQSKPCLRPQQCTWHQAAAQRSRN